MRLTVCRSGGFAGLPGRPREIAPDGDPELEALLRDVVTAVCAPREAPSRGADHYVYALTVDDGSGPVTAELRGDELPPALQRRLDALL